LLLIFAANPSRCFWCCMHLFIKVVLHAQAVLLLWLHILRACAAAATQPTCSC
jgi:hypothetical protein